MDEMKKVTPVNWDRLDVEIQHEGRAITLPGDPGKMPLGKAIEALVRKQQDEEQTFVVHEIIDAYPLDGAVAFVKAMTKLYGWASPQTEIVMTMMFLIIILGATDKLAPSGFAPLPIGLGLTLIHLISIPVTNTSVNPARSTGVAVFVGDWATAQLWLFWAAPLFGAVLGAVIYKTIAPRQN